MSIPGIQVVESPFVGEDQMLVYNPGKDIPPMVLGPGEEATIERRVAHLIKHGAIIVVKNIGKFKESAGL